MAYCAHEFEAGKLPFPDAPRTCVRCGRLVVPARTQLTHVAEARAILERARSTDYPSLSAAE